MLVTVYDEADALFAHLLVTVARRRGHTAKRVSNLDDIHDAFPSDPGAIVVGVGRADDVVISQIRELRARHEQALILLAAEEASSGHTIAALESGANNILRKPLMPRELIIWLEQAQPAREDEASKGAIQVADLEIDIDQVRASKAGRELTLTRMEFRLLYCLAQHYGRIAPTDRLMTFGGDSDEMAASSLKTHISHLRQKLREAGGVPFRITARQMLGYVLEATPIEAR